MTAKQDRQGTGRRPRWRWWSFGLNIALVAALAWLLVEGRLGIAQGEGPEVRVPGAPEPGRILPPDAGLEAEEAAREALEERLTGDELETIRQFEAVSPSVVYIARHDVARDPFSLNLTRITRGTGSGFVWNDEGYIVTNYHVVQGAQGAEVTLADQSAWEADLVGAAPEKDLAVLKIDAPAEQLYPIGVGRSHPLRVGQSVMAIGNPFGLDQTLTTGVISGLGREITAPDGSVITDLIQTDAAINPGNSGGPLLNSAGEMIGVNTAIYSMTGGYSGVGLAIPSDVVSRVVPEIIEHGRAVRPGLGVSLVHDSIARRLGITGVLINEVTEGSAAERAGMQGTRITRAGGIEQLGDIIIGVDGTVVTNSFELHRRLSRYTVGDEITVTVWRPGEGEALRLEVELQAINLAE